jgi:NAD(P)H-flavin reductase
MTSHGVRTDQVIAGVPTLTATVEGIVDEGSKTYTYWSTIDDPDARAGFRFLPGQIDMVGVFGVGEVPISPSSDPAELGRLAHTIRVCGRVTEVIGRLQVGDRITLRGPFGRPWPVERAQGGDLVIVAGGLGMAPLRSAVHWVVRRRESYRRVLLLVGARDPGQVLYRGELEALRDGGHDLEVHFTVDRADADWPYREGLITSLFPFVDVDPKAATVFTCGPEIMMQAAMYALARLGIPNERLWLTMERNMHCAVKLCGHCQLGPYFVCADGPIFRWDEVAHLLEVSEL